MNRLVVAVFAVVCFGLPGCDCSGAISGPDAGTGGGVSAGGGSATGGGVAGGAAGGVAGGDAGGAGGGDAGGAAGGDAGGMAGGAAGGGDAGGVAGGDAGGAAGGTAGGAAGGTAGGAAGGTAGGAAGGMAGGAAGGTAGGAAGGTAGGSGGGSTVNECLNGTANCSANATCTDTPTSFTCTCNSGYGGDGVTCTDLDECVGQGTGNNCSPNATCTNTVGGFTCACNAGYGGTGVTCTDLDECAGQGTGNTCGMNATCTNLPGTFRCACSTGFGGDGGTCTDLDECLGQGTGNNCSTNATCANTAPGFTCTCNSGYGGDGGSCIDFNECAGQGTGNNCGTNASCTNLPGTFRCACLTGFGGDGGTCTDYDECMGQGAGNNCSAFATCTNTPGSFTCTCLTGYSGTGVVCNDINECTTGGFCSPLASCLNTPGAYMCGTCAPPYLDQNMNGTVCLDPCMTMTSQCSPSATCASALQPGGYTCTCGAGYVGDGYTCAAKTSCSGGPAACDANATCSGGVCTCNTGWAGNGGTCVAACFPGALGTCANGGWFGVAGSDLGPWPQLLTAGSAWGPGVSNVQVLTNTLRGVDVAVDPAGNPFVVFVHDNYPGASYGYGTYFGIVRRYLNGTWVPVGDGGTIGIVSYNPRIAVDPTGTPIVAWTNGSGVFVRRWNGSAWGEVPGGDGGAIGTGSPSHVSLALTPAGAPVVSWVNASTVYLKRNTGAVWEELASSGTTGVGPAGAAGLAVDGTGNPYLAYAPGNEILVKRWNGSAWVEVGAGSSDQDAGGISFTPDASGTYPAIAIDSSGRPVVAWQEGPNPSASIFARRFDGTSWVEMGAGSATGRGLSNNTGNATDPALAAGPSGELTVTWTQTTNGLSTTDIYARRFNGSAWAEVAGSASDGGISNDAITSDTARVVYDSSGRPVVAWHLAAGIFSLAGEQVGLRRLEAGAWAEVPAGTAVGGGLSNDPAFSRAPRIVLDRSRRPIVVWQDYVAPSEWVRSRWYLDGGWVDLGSRNGTSPSVALGADGLPVIAYAAPAYPHEIYVDRFDGTAWQPVGYGDGGVSDTRSDSTSPAIAVDVAGRPVVAWSDSSDGGNQEIFLRRYEGGAWVEVGGIATATGPGISGTATRSYEPDLALDLAGRPTVVWADDVGSPNYATFLRQLTTTGWGPVLRQTTFSLRQPTVMIDSTGTPIVAAMNWTTAYGLLLFRVTNNTWFGFTGSPSFAGGRSPSIVDDGTGKPIVAWDSAYRTTNGWEIFTSRWDGTQWVNIGTASADAGISLSQARSLTPRAAKRGDTMCVAWLENTSKGEDIIVRCNYALP